MFLYRLTPRSFVHVDPVTVKRAVWDLMGLGPDTPRDWLWRGELVRGRPQVTLLTPREPQDPKFLWDIEPLAWPPPLSAGQRMSFKLRFGAHTLKGSNHNGRGTRRRSLYDAASDGMTRQEREFVGESEIARVVYGAWLRDHLAGADLDPRTIAVERLPVIHVREKLPVHHVEISGTLIVGEPSALVQRIEEGFGTQKSWGGGLMVLTHG